MALSAVVPASVRAKFSVDANGYIKTSPTTTAADTKTKTFSIVKAPTNPSDVTFSNGLATFGESFADIFPIASGSIEFDRLTVNYKWEV